MVLAGELVAVLLAQDRITNLDCTRHHLTKAATVAPMAATILASTASQEAVRQDFRRVLRPALATPMVVVVVVARQRRGAKAASAVTAMRLVRVRLRVPMAHPAVVVAAITERAERVVMARPAS
jgi:hypothetical protein